MVSALFDLRTLAEPLARGDLILTANNRLRNHMLRAVAADQPSGVWRPPAIQPLNQWIMAQWETLQNRAHPATATLMASNLQRQILWQQVIQDSAAGPALLQVEDLAANADAALRNLELWQLTEAQLDAEHGPNSEWFLTWLAAFKQQLTARPLITSESAQAVVLNAFREQLLPRRERIYLYGFDLLPPLHRELLTHACDELIELAPASVASAQVHRIEAATEDTEIRSAALWSQAILAHDPHAVIGIIVPNLGQTRPQVERIFTEVFEPLAPLPQTPRYTQPFNFSAGIPLATTPLVQTALTLLNLNRSTIELESFCALLTSPFFGDTETELVMRSLLDEKLRKQGQFTLSLADVLHQTQALGTAFTLTEENNLHARLLSLEHNRRAVRGNHSASYWAALFQRQLSALGWPGVRRLDSQEYQQMSLWQQLLEEFCALDSGSPSFDLNQALKYLRTLAGTTPFQAQTPNSPIQILGALEGAGLYFSHCWVMGLHHRQWPPAPSPNPLLPVHLQRQHNMPHASAERELTFARALTANFRCCAPQVILSSAATDGDTELLPSALIRDLPATPISGLTQSGLTQSGLTQSGLPLAVPTESVTQQNYRTIAASQVLELVHCARGPALPVGSKVRGGSALFKLQAACPFNAFAELRLNAQPLEAPHIGFSAQERGTLLHNALATIWRQLQDSARLHETNDEELLTLVRTATADAIRPFQQRRPRALGPFYCQLEQERLIRLLSAWLELEKQRPPFTVVEIEEKHTLTFAGVQVDLRIDRIDQLTGEQRLLIDYKTGIPNVRSLWGNRPDEPQLPLYAVSQTQPVAALAFAQINPKALAWLGTGELSEFHEGINTPPQEWPLQLEEWREVLTRLAQDFLAGDARVDFKDQKAQQYAGDLLPLNRLLEGPQIDALLAENALPMAGGH
jgi:ATP-dependent helicase/nuclease subunit B